MNPIHLNQGTMCRPIIKVLILEKGPKRSMKVPISPNVHVIYHIEKPLGRIRC